MEHGAQFFGYSALRLGPVVREQYLGFVGANFPELLARYERAVRDHPPLLTGRRGWPCRGP